jgi:glutathione S-transferase
MSRQPAAVLYSFRRCPYAMRARLAIAASGLVCELREVLLREKPPELIAASAKATVPVLVTTAGTVIAESLDIMLWALRQNDPQHWLAPTIDSPDSALQLIARFDEGFKPHLDRYKYPGRYASDSADHRSACAGFIDELEARLGRSAFFCGVHQSLADAAIAPFVRQFAHTDMAWFGAQAWPRVITWLADFEASDGFERVMRKYPRWQAGAPVTMFP